jgi:hypothetical protein
MGPPCSIIPSALVRRASGIGLLRRANARAPFPERSPGATYLSGDRFAEAPLSAGLASSNAASSKVNAATRGWVS